MCTLEYYTNNNLNFHINRCLAYTDFPDYCKLVDNPSDPCCQQLKCVKDNMVLTPVIKDHGGKPNPTGDPNNKTIVPIITHRVITGKGRPKKARVPELKRYGGNGKMKCSFQDFKINPLSEELLKKI